MAQSGSRCWGLLPFGGHCDALAPLLGSASEQVGAQALVGKVGAAYMCRVATTAHNHRLERR